jgi:hypothetical protein
MDWLRLYSDMPSDPKIGTLTDAEFRTWIELLCAAGKHGVDGDTGLTAATINWALRRDVTVTVPRLIERDLVTINEAGNYVIKAWEKRQHKSDSSAERTREYRARIKAGAPARASGLSVTSPSRHSDALDTEADTEADTELDKSVFVGGAADDEAPAKGTPPRPAARSESSMGKRLPKGWMLPKAWGDWALAEKPGWEPDQVRRVAELFRDHWIAKAGKEGRKADWEATWRNWVRREQSLSGALNTRTGGATGNRQEALEAKNQKIADRLAGELE